MLTSYSTFTDLLHRPNFYCCWLVCLFVYEMGFCYVARAGLKTIVLLTSSF